MIELTNIHNTHPTQSAPPEAEVVAVAVQSPPQYGLGGMDAPAKPFAYEYAPSAGLGGAPVSAYSTTGASAPQSY
jgi:hypothetical protein